MPRYCRTLFDDKGNAFGIACGSKPDHKCSSCGSFGANIQCDSPTKTKSGTCDRWLCRRCAVNVGANRDYCPAHDRLSREAPGG